MLIVNQAGYFVLLPTPHTQVRVVGQFSRAEAGSYVINLGRLLTERE